ncbi:MAG: hypothetical protein Tsb0014_11620 [Pleurocapsa sp.]
MTKLIIVDDQNSIVEFLKVNLSSEPDIQILGLANDGKTAISLVAKYRPDIVLMDIEMPLMDGILATQIISKKFFDTRVILLTSKDDREQLNLAIKAGARGYILKNTSTKDLVQIIRLTEKGFVQIGPILHIWNYPESSDQSTQLQTYNNEDRPQATDSNNTSEMNRMLANLTSGLFQLQETIQSQENTIVHLTNQYAEVQQEIRHRLGDKRLLNDIRASHYKARKAQLSLTERKQNVIFVSSFLLGVLTVCVVIGIIMGLGIFLP